MRVDDVRQTGSVGAETFGQILNTDGRIKKNLSLFHRFLQVSQYPPLLFVGNNLDIVRSGFHECVFLLLGFKTLLHQFSVRPAAVDEQDQEQDVRHRQNN